MHLMNAFSSNAETRAKYELRAMFRDESGRVQPVVESFIAEQRLARSGVPFNNESAESLEAGKCFLCLGMHLHSICCTLTPCFNHRVCCGTRHSAISCQC